MIKKAMLWSLLIIFIFMFIGCTTIDKNDTNGSDKPSPGQSIPEPKPIEKDPIAEKIKDMTLQEKLGQMMIVGVEGYEADDGARKMIEELHVGGFILFGSNIKSPEQLLELNNSLKTANLVNKTPLFISIDEEGGRISRIPKVIKNLPTNKNIGKINNEEFSYEVGMLLAEKVSAFGFNMDFAPVLDINSNPKNPVIGDRAFGSEVEVVRDLGVQTMIGIRTSGVIPVVKHFPGHGDTAVDSHIGLPTVDNDLERLKSFELIPFKAAIDNGAECVMVAHILLSEIDAENPATLSKTIISDILRNQLEFEGVVITDDMTMGAITKNYDLASAAVQSVGAGSDIILVAHKYENAVAVMKALDEAVQAGRITEERIDQSVYRILKLKQMYNLQDITIKTVDIEEINQKITDTLDKYIKSK
jgi:beta-N-acetylhexosaminidase